MELDLKSRVGSHVHIRNRIAHPTGYQGHGAAQDLGERGVSMDVCTGVCFQGSAARNYTQERPTCNILVSHSDHSSYENV